MALTQQIDNYPGFEDSVDGFTPGGEDAGPGGAVRRADRVCPGGAAGPHRQPQGAGDQRGDLLGKTVVLATGADPRKLGVDHEEALVGRGVAYCAACDGMFYRGKTVVVVGGGNSAAADALLLSRIAKRSFWFTAGTPSGPRRSTTSL